MNTLTAALFTCMASSGTEFDGAWLCMYLDISLCNSNLAEYIVLSNLGPGQLQALHDTWLQYTKSDDNNNIPSYPVYMDDEDMWQSPMHFSLGDHDHRLPGTTPANPDCMYCMSTASLLHHNLLSGLSNIPSKLYGKHPPSVLELRPFSYCQITRGRLQRV